MAATLSLVALGTASGSARAEPPPADTPSPTPDAPDANETPSSEDEASALERLEAQIRELRADQAKLKEQLGALKRKQARPPTVLPPPTNEGVASALHPTASVGLRYDNIFPPDPTEQYRGEPHIDGLHMRVRAGVRLFDDTSVVTGEVRFALGLPDNPAVAWVPLGDGFRVSSVGLDRYWASFRPFEDRSVAALTVGKMPVPFWHGDGLLSRSELTWDVDVHPTGIALDIKFLERDGVKVDNTFGYFVAHDIEDLRFIGLTGPVSLIANQLRVRWKYVTGAFAFYNYENLNAGMSAAGATTDGGISGQSGAPAFLMSDGFQVTNNRVSYGLGAEGFVAESFRVINPTLQGNIPLPLDDLGEGTALFLLLDYSHNLAVPNDANGIGGTAGINTGDHRSGWLRPLSLWFTYRFVQADATLATFADSNLGLGTDYRGFEIGATYSPIPSVSLNAGYFDYLGAPRQDAQLRRFLVEVQWNHGP